MTRLDRTRSTAKRVISVFVVMLGLAACGGGEDTPPTPAPPTSPTATTFSFLIRGKSVDERFLYRTESSARIAAMRQQLALPAENRRLFPAGTIAAGNGGFNLNWGWHYTEMELVESAIEVCDATPSMVQANLNYWLTTVKNFCPWAAYVEAEIK